MKRSDSSGLMSILIFCLMILFVLPVIGFRMLVTENASIGYQMFGMILLVFGVVMWGVVLFG